ncbi:arginase family protein [Microbacterium hydrocarbonoxydans]|uniref:arginase family protein n=1 Tax=Microbacterium hydrocarbonoxydans TaxID=273678 RepID=UPI0007BC2271|nr:arginase family protein [Microbacterium hydrocarbonoxydans]GAT73250.1 arginase/agmatinase/formiminoglutamase [Microbacterium sp. HM58-2]
MIAIVSAPTNLGLRPPVPGAVPGTAKAPEALREAGLHHVLLRRGAVEAGVVLPGRYVDDPGRPVGTLRNQDAIVEHARRLAPRLVELRRGGHAPLVLGGDCSLVVAAGLAARVSGGGGLVHVDGHTDFRNPGNSAAIGALAGEDLAAAIGRHLPEIADIDGLGPYFDPAATAHVGCRRDDDFLEEVTAAIALTIPADQIILHGGARAASRILDSPGLERGFWLQVDVDVLDPEHMPAVDSPDPGGLTPDELIAFLRLAAPRAWGASVTVLDPDLDPDGTHARTVATVIAEGLDRLGEEAEQPED